MTTWMISGTLGFIAGGALIWFCKDWIMLRYKTTEDYVGELNDKIKAIKGK